MRHERKRRDTKDRRYTRHETRDRRHEIRDIGQETGAGDMDLGILMDVQIHEIRDTRQVTPGVRGTRQERYTRHETRDTRHGKLDTRYGRLDRRQAMPDTRDTRRNTRDRRGKA